MLSGENKVIKVTDSLFDRSKQEGLLQEQIIFKALPQ